MALAKYAGEGTALYRVRSREAETSEASGQPRPVGHYSDWSPDRHIAAMTLDAMHIANWQRANAGAKSPSKPPEPMWRPGIQPERTPDGFLKNPDGTKQVGHDPIPASEFASWWAATQEERDSWKAA